MSEHDQVDRERVERELLDDAQTMRIARGVTAVERAVRSYHDRQPGALDALVPAAVAQRMGWTVCSRCGRPLSPGWCIQRGEERFHPSCTIVVILGERGDRARAHCGAFAAVAGLVGPGSGSPSIPLCQGDAGAARIAAGGLPDASQVAA